jgi:chromosome segregation ATPase
MAELVADMQDQVKSGTGKLASLLANNGMFLNSTMAALAADASAVQRGVVDGSTDVLGAVQDSMAKTGALSSAQMNQLGNLGDQTAALSQITGDQMTQLMTILLAQSAFQSDANIASYKSALSRTADVKTAMKMYSDAMADASQADVDALQEAASVSDDIDTKAQASVQAATTAAMQAAQNYTDQANADYQAIQNALNAAAPVIEGLKTRVENAQKTFDDQSPQIESQISGVQADINKLQTTITSTQQSQVDRVTAWIRSMQTNTINSLKRFQAALATTTTTTTTTSITTTTTTTTTTTPASATTVVNA